MLLALTLLAQVTTSTPAPTKTPPPNPFAATAAVGTAPRTLGTDSPRSTDIGSLGARVKLNRAKADKLFRQDVAPYPEPVSVTTPPAKAGKDGLPSAIAEAEAAEISWRGREADRRSRLHAAQQNQREICARYQAAAAASGGQDGYLTRESAEGFRALRAGCEDATRKADGVAAEAETLASQCRQTFGCQPGWLR